MERVSGSFIKESLSPFISCSPLLMFINVYKREDVLTDKVLVWPLKKLERLNRV